MSVLSDLKDTLTPLNIPLETGVFSDKAPDKYLVIVPLSDTFAVHADNLPGYDVQEARLSLFCKGSYTADKNQIIRSLLASDFTVTGRLYNGFDTETGYHHYVVDVAKHYEMEE